MVRRRALHLLSTCNRKEAIWDSAIATRMAERIILIEEAGATTTQITHASQIPAHARILESSVYFGPGRQGKLIYHRAGDEMNRNLIEQQSEHIVW
jgi:hemin uptake protein HemP